MAAYDKIVKTKLFPLCLGVLAVAVIVVTIVRYQAAPVPLERDEGEYALLGQLILDGVPPYLEAGNMKLPGIYYAYSAILAIFGQTARGIHLGLMAVNLLTTAILYMIALPLLGGAGAALAAAAFIIMSVDTSVLGLFAHATHFVMLFVLAGLWLLQASSRSKHEILLLLGSGLCLGVSVLMKQPGALFAVFALAWTLYGSLRRRPVSWKGLLLRSGVLTCGIVLPYAMVLALMAANGVLARFWFWTVDYAIAYGSLTELKEGLKLLGSGVIRIIKSNPVLWSIALAGIIGIRRTEPGRRVAPFLLSFCLFSFLAVCPGLYFRPHYFVQLLPAAAISAAAAAVWMLQPLVAMHASKSKLIQFAILVAVVGVTLIRPFSILRTLSKSTPDQFSRSVYGTDPFPESVKVAQYLAWNTRPEDRIAILGCEPQICFYAHRRPASEHIYMYGLMEPQPFALRMQEEFIAQVEKSEPPFLVFTDPASWSQRRDSETKIFAWMTDYLQDHYQPVMAALIYRDRTVWLVDKEAEFFAQRRDLNQMLMVVFKLKNR